MNETNQSKNAKDVFSVYKSNTDKIFNAVRQSVPQYHQAITNVQQECLQAYENAANSAITFQKDIAKKSGVATSIPEATIRIMDETTEEIAKASSINNQVILATLDAAQQNVKTFSDNAKSFTNLSRDILQSWISAFAIRTN